MEGRIARCHVVTLALLCGLSWALAPGVSRCADKNAGGETSADAAIAKKTTTGPLAEYVAKDDASYRWIKRQSLKIGPTEVVELTLTSQTWRDIPWKHQLFVFYPSTATQKSSHGLLFIAGGNWNDALEKPPVDQKLPGEARMFAMLCEQLATPVSVLLQVPQQPIFGGKREDEIIAMTFEKFLRTGDTEWPLLLPMVKSAVRGLDATVEFVQQQWKTKLKTFTVTGASKRGWTTWLTGAVDARATAIAPMVIDMLNMSPQMKHQVAAWGDFSREIHDYTDLGLQKYLDTPRGKALHAIVDPYAYRAFLKQPKLILLGTNDRYWPLDALNLYWNELSGEKYILYIPNNGHGLKDIVRISGSLGALHDRAAGKLTLPKLSWKLTEAAGELSMRVESDVAPKSVVAWVAHSATRDFRDSHWSSHPTKANKSGHEFAIAIPKGRFSALYGEAVYNGRTLPYYLSTNVRIVGSKPEPAGGK